MPAARTKPTRSDPSAALNAALERLDREEREAALASLLEAWRESGDARIASAVEALSAKLTEDEKPIAAVGSKSGKTLWYEASESKRPAVLERMLEVLPDAVDCNKRLEALMTWPPDPRIGAWAKRWIEAPPVKGKHRQGFFTRLWALIEYTRDARLAPLVASISDASERASSVSRYGLKSWGPLGEMAERYEKLTAPPPLAPGDVSTLERIEAALTRPASKKVIGSNANEEALFARVYEAPDDDEPRAILADLLQQKGDPRGELIALQLARYGTGKPPTTAEKKLLQTWGRKWLGPLDEVLLKDGIEFERGFLTRCRYEGDGPERPSYGAHEWSTVTHIDVSRASRLTGGSGELLLKPELRNIRHVTGLDYGDHRKLIAKDALPWETVGWRAWAWDHLEHVLAGAGDLFAAARTLIIAHAERLILNPRTTEMVVDLLEKWPNIEVFEVRVATSHVVPLRAHARGRRLRRLVVHDESMSVAVEGDSLDVTLHHLVEESTAEVERLMRELKPARVAVSTEKGRLEGDKLFKKYAGTSMTPLAKAAAKSGIALQVQGAPFPP